MRRLLFLALFAAVVVSACSDSGGEPATTTVADDTATTTGDTSSDTTEADTETTTADEDSSTTSTAPDSTDTTSGRPGAPDFTLQLGDGGAYTLSEGSKPVYLVFWAEW